jgi:hypothetical protein
MLPDDAFADAEDLLPEQLLDRARCGARNSTAHRLMLGVLADAIGLYLRANDPRRHMAPSRRREILAWFASPDRSWLFSFERICEALDFDADYLRRGLWRRAGALSVMAEGRHRIEIGGIVPAGGLPARAITRS